MPKMWIHLARRMAGFHRDRSPRHRQKVRCEVIRWSLGLQYMAIKNGLMSCHLIEVFVLSALTVVIVGNTQAKKSPIKLIRNGSHNKDTNNTSNPVSNSPSRPSTSIDPLSHVWQPFSIFKVSKEPDPKPTLIISPIIPFSSEQLPNFSRTGPRH